MTDFKANSDDIHQTKRKLRDVTFYISIVIGIFEIVAWVGFGSSLAYKIMFGLLAVLVALVRLNEFRVLAIARDVHDEHLIRSCSFKLVITFVVTCASLGMVVVQGMQGYSEAAKNADPQVKAAQAALNVASQKLQAVQSSHTYTEAQLASAQADLDAVNKRIDELQKAFREENLAAIQAHLKNVRDFWEKPYQPGSKLKVKDIMTSKCVAKSPYGGPMTTAAGEWCEKLKALEAQSPAAIANATSPEVKELGKQKEELAKVIAAKSQIDAAQLVVTQGEQRLYALLEALKNKEIYPPFFEKFSMLLSQAGFNLSALILAVAILMLIIYVIVSSPADFESAAVHLQMRLAGREYQPVQPKEGLIERGIKLAVTKYNQWKVRKDSRVQTEVRTDLPQPPKRVNAVHTDTDERKDSVHTPIATKPVAPVQTTVVDTDELSADERAAIERIATEINAKDNTSVCTDVPETAKAIRPPVTVVKESNTKTDPNELDRIYGEVVEQIKNGQRSHNLSYSSFKKSYALSNGDIDILRIRLVKAGFAVWVKGRLGKECYVKQPIASKKPNGSGTSVDSSPVPMAAAAQS